MVRTPPPRLRRECVGGRPRPTPRRARRCSLGRKAIGRSKRCPFDEGNPCPAARCRIDGELVHQTTASREAESHRIGGTVTSGEHPIEVGYSRPLVSELYPNTLADIVGQPFDDGDAVTGVHPHVAGELRGSRGDRCTEKNIEVAGRGQIAHLAPNECDVVFGLDAHLVALFDAFAHEGLILLVASSAAPPAPPAN